MDKFCPLQGSQNWFIAKIKRQKNLSTNPERKAYTEISRDPGTRNKNYIMKKPKSSSFARIALRPTSAMPACAMAAAPSLGAERDRDRRHAYGDRARPVRHHLFGDTTARLLLAKNPAGWAEALPLAQISWSLHRFRRCRDGRDVSWLWDVEYEKLAGRTVVATGPRAWIWRSGWRTRTWNAAAYPTWPRHSPVMPNRWT